MVICPIECNAMLSSCRRSENLGLKNQNPSTQVQYPVHGEGMDMQALHAAAAAAGMEPQHVDAGQLAHHHHHDHLGQGLQPHAVDHQVL